MRAAGYGLLSFDPASRVLSGARVVTVTVGATPVATMYHARPPTAIEHFRRRSDRRTPPLPPARCTVHISIIPVQSHLPSPLAWRVRANQLRARAKVNHACHDHRMYHHHAKQADVKLTSSQSLYASAPRAPFLLYRLPLMLEPRVSSMYHAAYVTECNDQR